MMSALPYILAVVAFFGIIELFSSPTRRGGSNGPPPAGPKPEPPPAPPPAPHWKRGRG